MRVIATSLLDGPAEIMCRDDGLRVLVLKEGTVVNAALAEVLTRLIAATDRCRET